MRPVRMGEGWKAAASCKGDIGFCSLSKTVKILDVEPSGEEMPSCVEAR